MSIHQMANILHLPFIKNNYEEIINKLMDKQHSYEQFLESILSAEIEARSQYGIKSRIRRAKFPYLRTFEELKYDALPLDISNKIRELQNLKFIE